MESFYRKAFSYQGKCIEMEEPLKHFQVDGGFSGFSEIKHKNTVLMNCMFSSQLAPFQLMVDLANLEIGQNVLLNVEEELRLDLEPAQTLLLQTEELTVQEQAARPENVMLENVLVRLRCCTFM